MWIRAVKPILAAGVIAIAGLQLAPGPERSNPPILPGHSLYESVSVPGPVRDHLRRACMNCHSNETRWPWYSHLAPIRWGVASDVSRARKAFNISEWTSQGGRSPMKAVGVLTAICSGVSSGRMPLAKYRLLHPESRLSAGDRKAICDWTSVEIQRQIAIHKKAVLSRSSR